LFAAILSTVAEVLTRTISDISNHCVAIDWILDHMGTKPHFEVGRQIFSDLAYADDTAFLFSSEDNITPCLHSFSQTAATLGVRTSWAKTKLQNLGSGPSPTSLQIDGNFLDLNVYSASHSYSVASC